VRLRADDRGLGYLIALGGMMVIMASVLLAALGPAFADIHDKATSLSDTPEADQGLSWVKSAFDLTPLFGLLLGAVMIVAGASRETGGIGR
jgi:hypothetical protein